MYVPEMLPTGQTVSARPTRLHHDPAELSDVQKVVYSCVAARRCPSRDRIGTALTARGSGKDLMNQTRREMTALSLARPMLRWILEPSPSRQMLDRIAHSTCVTKTFDSCRTTVTLAPHRTVASSPCHTHTAATAGNLLQSESDILDCRVFRPPALCLSPGLNS
jgi:hypothetical protein